MLIPVFAALSAWRSDAPSGQDIYQKKCKRCHGETGGKGLFGAKSLLISRMKYDDVVRIISEGKRPMPGFQNKLSAEEIKLVATYVLSLRKY